MHVAMSYNVVAELAVRHCLLSINRQMLYVDTACELGIGFIIHLLVTIITVITVQNDVAL